MSALNRQLALDYELTSPDAHDVASQWVKYRRTVAGKAPAAADLAQTITGIGDDLTMQGAPEIEIDLFDDGWKLLDSGFFDPQQHGTLDKVEINYPLGSKYFWRLRQFSPQQGSPFTVQTFWIPRVVDDLMNTYGPFSASRSQRTRAQFLKMCAAKVPYANFYSKQLDDQQPIANIVVPKTTTTSKSKTNVIVAPVTSGPKSIGISAAAAKGLTVKGVPMTPAQARAATTLLKVADRLHAGKIATEAMIYAAIWESGLNEQAGPNNLGYAGILSGSYAHFKYDTVAMATAFLQGGQGFQEGGAIHLATKGTVGTVVSNLNLAYGKAITNPIEIAVRVEVPSIWPSNAYAQESGYIGDAKALAEAQAIVEGGGGASGVGGVKASSTEVVQNYNYTIGTTSDPHEDFWTGMNRLVQEVNWELIIDGDDIYYDSDRTLTRQPVADVITRDQVGEDDWGYDWDKNLIVANFQLILECDPFQYVQGQVLQLKKFGPASEAMSSVGLPGRWLIGEIQRNPGDIVSTLTLVQPTSPLKEPAPTVKTAGKGVKGDASPGTVLALVAAAQKLSGWKIPYVYGGGHKSDNNTITDAKTLRSEGLDCSSSTYWALYQAGLISDKTPGVSGDAMTLGAAGPGQEVTIWASSFHVFLEFNVPGVGHYTLDTAYPGANGPTWGLWSSTEQANATGGAFVARHIPGT